VWNPAESEPPAGEQDRITIACLAHYAGGKTVFGCLAACPQLEVFQIASAGFEHALPSVPEGVAVANARGVHDSRAAEITLARALASGRQLVDFFDALRRQTWEPSFGARSLADSRALVVGYGSIGEAIVVTPHTDETDKLVDTEVLLAELESTRLFAALDVTDPGPLPTGHPLWSVPQCIIVPHVAGGEPVRAEVLWRW